MIATPPAVLIDCDPGIDDCLALMYLAGLHHAREIELVGVTTTAGNVEAYQTAANARWILDLCSLADVPVAPGLPHPLKVGLTTTPETMVRRDWAMPLHLLPRCTTAIGSVYGKKH